MILNKLRLDNTVVVELDVTKQLVTSNKETPVRAMIVLGSDGYRRGYIGYNETGIANPKLLVESFDVEAHGGVTYDERISSVTRVLGFDCAHAGDRRDIEAVRKYEAKGLIHVGDFEKENLLWEEHKDYGEVRTAEYVRDCIVSALQRYKGEVYLESLI